MSRRGMALVFSLTKSVRRKMLLLAVSIALLGAG